MIGKKAPPVDGVAGGSGGGWVLMLNRGQRAAQQAGGDQLCDPESAEKVVI